MNAQARERTTTKVVTDPPRPDLLWPYYTRIIAICMVVLIHTVAGTVVSSAIGSRTWWGSVLLDASASWAVPVFIMMSGALLLAPGHRMSTGAFYQRRLLRIGLPALAWIGIYLAYRQWYLDEQFGVREALTFTFAGYPARHLYYLFVIIGLYAITPLLRILADNMSQRQLVGLTATCLTLSWFNYYLANTLGVPATPNAISLFLPHLGYFLAGYVLRELAVRGVRLLLMIVAVAATIIGQAVEAYLLGSLSPLSRFSALTIVMSLLAFMVLLQVGRIATERGYTGRVSRVLAGTAFGVYLSHLIVLELFTAATDISLRPATVGTLALTLVATIVLSSALILVIQRIPLLKQLV